jgi:soluble lytic murein transglycosylase
MFHSVAEKHHFDYDKSMKYLVSIILLLIFCFPVYGEELDGKAYLQKGRDDLKNSRYDDAIVSLKKAEKEFPVLGDYALLWLSAAYHETGDHKRSLETIRTLLKQYPDSSLGKESRSREIEEALKVSEENIQTLYESYIKDYPSDTEIKYSFARWLKQDGQTEKAKLLFKEIYRDARVFSTMALQELDASDIGVGDMLQHASNHIRQMNYATAEPILRKALAKDDGSLKTEILKKLALCLFRQKKYQKASDIYKQVGEQYWEIRSLYRAGEKTALDDALDELFAVNDARMSSILLALAADRRRDGKSQDAIALYRDIMEKFPSEAEESLWGTGWTYFLGGEYRKASEIFSRLHNTYGGTKYLYWKTRSLELCGEDAPTDHVPSLGSRIDFYSIMLNMRTAKSQQQSNSKVQEGFVSTVNVVQAAAPSFGMIERIEYLFALGLQNEALSEMTHLSKNTRSFDDILYLCSKFEESGEYRSSVRLAGRIPNSDMVRHFLYPRAYKDSIEALSAQYSLDPFLVLSIVREESRFDYEARSPAGAIGLMQLMPGTAFRLDRKLNLGIRYSRDLNDIRKNLRIGTYYLSALVREFGAYPQAIAAYNAGEETVRKWLQKGKYKSTDEFIEDIPYRETRNYVKRVLTTFFEYKRSYAKDPHTVSLTLESM